MGSFRPSRPVPYSIDWAISSTSAWACLAAASGVSWPVEHGGQRLGDRLLGRQGPDDLALALLEAPPVHGVGALGQGLQDLGRVQLRQRRLGVHPAGSLLQASVYSGLSLVPERAGNLPSGVTASQST